MSTVRPLSRVGRGWRLLVLAVMVVLFGLGSVIGDDHWWPVGPWRMFSTSTDPNRAVVSTVIEVHTEAQPQVWVPSAIKLSEVGLNRAEVEGRLDQIRADPTLLATLAETRRQLRPDEPAWTGIRVVFERTHLEGGRPTGETSRQVVATWEQGG